MGALAKNVLVGLAVVAIVIVAVVTVAVTCGAAAPVIGTIAGTAAVASQAASDISRGEVSDMSDYVSAGAREAFIGAVSGAIFGPFGAGEALARKMVLGGVTNRFESALRQTLEGKGIDFKTVLFDMGIGAVTGGLFHGAGKLFKKASPFVKNTFSKIITNNESMLNKTTKILDDTLAPIRAVQTS
ncbi:hypothetical protein [Clostridium sp.]|uniref:hypothetical protein n=1 Tax=Clostridium sp. TaxID=1506 RepID=UPI002630C913|nr:hypothetical protein [Clostridium sp.]